MSEDFDVWFIAVIFIVLVGMTAFYVLLWHGRFFPGKHVGMRREEHRRQVGRAIERGIPGMGALVLIAARMALDLCHMSRVRHAYWSGIITAFVLSLTALLVYNAVAEARRLQNERRREHGDTELVAEDGGRKT